VLPETTDDFNLQVVGSSDDNGRVGSSGEDWFRIDFKGPERRRLTACLGIVDQQVTARLRCYHVDTEVGAATAKPGELLVISEYAEGKNPNERPHAQVDSRFRYASS